MLRCQIFSIFSCACTRYWCYAVRSSLAHAHMHIHLILTWCYAVKSSLWVCESRNDKMEKGRWKTCSRNDMFFSLLLSLRCFSRHTTAHIIPELAKLWVYRFLTFAWKLKMHCCDKPCHLEIGTTCDWKTMLDLVKTGNVQNTIDSSKSVKRNNRPKVVISVKWFKLKNPKNRNSEFFLSLKSQKRTFPKQPLTSFVMFNALSVVALHMGVASVAASTSHYFEINLDSAPFPNNKSVGCSQLLNLNFQKDCWPVELVSETTFKIKVKSRNWWNMMVFVLKWKCRNHQKLAVFDFSLKLQNKKNTVVLVFQWNSGKQWLW